MVASARPDAVVHLAGLSSVARSHREPARTFAVNALGAVNLLAAVKDEAPKARVVLVGSADMYGALAPDVRASEETPLRPLSPYASSKVAAEVAGFQFHRGAGLAVITTRSFNHLGTGQRPDFVVPSFAHQIAAIRRDGRRPVLQVGNLSAIRDFSHVRDVVAAYRLLAVRGAPGEPYNVCSGEGRSIRSVLDAMLKLAAIDVAIDVDPSRLRANDQPSLVGDPSKLMRLGWKPVYSLERALAEVLAEAQAASA
jgi:GDP-4-dehydro-6-deoxy-D-mannose reductase